MIFAKHLVTDVRDRRARLSRFERLDGGLAAFVISPEAGGAEIVTFEVEA